MCGARKHFVVAQLGCRCAKNSPAEKRKEWPRVCIQSDLMFESMNEYLKCLIFMPKQLVYIVSLLLNAQFARRLRENCECIIGQ